MPKYAYEYGKRWDARVPRCHVSFLLGRTHVGTPFEEIEADLRRRMEGDSKFTPTLVRQTIEYARIVHQRNFDLYRKVMK
jgi:hypothetical protein